MSMAFMRVPLMAPLVLLALASPASVPAQQPTPLYVALPDAFLDVDARAVLLREVDRDVLVLHPEEATVEAFGIGLMLLRRLRRDGPRPRSAAVVPMTGFSMTREWSPGQRRWLEQAMARLRARPTTRVGDLGPGRWIRLGRP